MLAATKLVDAPKPKKGDKPQISVPLHSEAELMVELDLAPGEQPSGIVAGALADRPFSIEEWDAVEAADGDR